MRGMIITPEIVVTKRTVEHDDSTRHVQPGFSIRFEGESMSIHDQRRLIECLVSDLIRKIEDRDTKLKEQA
jgi:hypothetical protein